MTVIHNLRVSPTCRRQIVQMYDANVDNGNNDGMRDIPCNLAAHFMGRNGVLDMTVFNRSNDMVWGAYGANAVHFSMLHEVIASFAGFPQGLYYQVSDNFHGYVHTLKPLVGLANHARQPPARGLLNPYEGEVSHFPMVNDTSMDDWFGDLEMFLDHEGEVIGYKDKFFRHVAIPMVQTHDLFKEKEYDRARTRAEDIKAPDWKKAVVEWLNRREAKRESRKSTD